LPFSHEFIILQTAMAILLCGFLIEPGTLLMPTFPFRTDLKPATYQLLQTSPAQPAYLFLLMLARISVDGRQRHHRFNPNICIWKIRCTLLLIRQNDVSGARQTIKISFVINEFNEHNSTPLLFGYTVFIPQRFVCQGQCEQLRFGEVMAKF
jgi:hypothetical protein